MYTANLLQKYNVAAPRYTSYPTVPYWLVDTFNTQAWLENLVIQYAQHANEGMSIYIHLPFCESLCTYCGCNTRITKNHGVELPYIQTVLKEWSMYVEVLGALPKVKEIHLGGGTPTFFSATHLNMLLKGILEQCVLMPNAEFSFEAHPANTTSAHLNTLYNLGFKRLSLGIQDFDAKVQLMINRFQTVQEVDNITREARAIGYTSINYDLIYGLPFQTAKGLQQTLASVIALRPDRIAFYSYAHVPWLKPGQRRYTEADLPQGDEKFKLYQLGRELLLQAGYVDIGMDHFALPEDSLYQAVLSGHLHRNFMGYTHQSTALMLGLGVSSISDSGNAFAQNEKNVENYLQYIQKGEFPVVKGHLHSREDLEIRKYITDLMCKGHTFLEHGVSAELQSRLDPLLQDGLITLNAHHLIVSPQGRLFLRNICMALDQKLWAAQPNQPLFSAAI